MLNISQMGTALSRMACTLLVVVTLDSIIEVCPLPVGTSERLNSLPSPGHSNSLQEYK
jgi:hypothetical protein